MWKHCFILSGGIIQIHTSQARSDLKTMDWGRFENSFYLSASLSVYHRPFVVILSLGHSSNILYLQAMEGLVNDQLIIFTDLLLFYAIQRDHGSLPTSLLKQCRTVFIYSTFFKTYLNLRISEQMHLGKRSMTFPTALRDVYRTLRGASRKGAPGKTDDHIVAHRGLWCP